jgi:hypothetical protein
MGMPVMMMMMLMMMMGPWLWWWWTRCHGVGFGLPGRVVWVKRVS